MHTLAFVILAPNGDLQLRRQCISDRYADPVQATGKCIRTARAFVEFATGMQARENNFNRRHLLFRVQADRNAATIILDADATVRI